MKIPFVAFLYIFLFWGCSKLPEITTNTSLNNSLEESKDFIVLSSTQQKATETLIFFPGGLVDPHSYLKWQDALVTQMPNLRIVTIKMPSNLAVLGANKGARLFEMYDDSQKWYVAGHSLGGAIATNFVAKHSDQINALVYLAAYPTDDRLANFPEGILSLYAENDGLVSQSDITDRVADLPTPIFVDSISQLPNELNNKTVYHQISGGNHAQFGNYGPQEGDQTATITSEVQQAILVTWISSYLQLLP